MNKRHSFTLFDRWTNRQLSINQRYAANLIRDYNTIGANNSSSSVDATTEVFEYGIIECGSSVCGSLNNLPNEYCLKIEN